jgi:hypothetical protein
VDVKVLTTKVGVTVGGLDLEDTVLDLEDRDIESTTAKIIDGDNAVSLLLETVSKGSSSRLVDDTEDVETGNLTSILGALTLSVVKVGRDSDDGVLDIPGEVSLGGLLHLVENEATNLRGRVLLVTGGDPSIAIAVLDNLVRNLLDVALDLGVGELAADQTLGGEECVLRVDDGLALGGDTNQTLTILGKGNDRGSCAGTCKCLLANQVTGYDSLGHQWMAWLTLRVFDDARNLALHDGDGRVGGSQIDTDHGTLNLFALAGRGRLIASESRCQRGSEGGRASGKGGSSGKLFLKSKLATGQEQESRQKLQFRKTYSSGKTRGQHL